MKHEITLDDNHVYHVAGRIVPGVTGIIRACGLMNTQWSSQWHMDRGTAVHRAVHLLEIDDLDPASVDPIVEPYLDAWKAFKRETDYQGHEYEQIVYHPTYQYAGTLDQTGVLNGRTCLIDLKTGKAQPYTAIQTAAYAACLKRPLLRYGVELRDDGKFQIHEYKNKRDFNVFLACLSVVNWKKDAE